MAIAKIPSAIKRARLSGGRRAEPQWMDDENMRKRVLRAYDLYIHHRTCDEIAEINNTSYIMAYRDVQRGLEMAAFMFGESLAALTAERVDVRRALIRTAMDMIDQIDKAQGKLKVKQRAKLELLNFIAGQETAIDNIVGLGRLRGLPEDEMPPDASSSKAIAAVMIVDARNDGTRVSLNGRPPIEAHAERITSEPVDEGDDEDEFAG